MKLLLNKSKKKTNLNMHTQLLELATKAVLEAGKILSHDFHNLGKVLSKGMHDVVSETDLKAEKLIIEMIRTNYPNHSIIAEESGRMVAESEYAWYVDPIDGTSNFVTGNPYFTISIGIAYKEEIIVGVVYNPILDELFHAIKGEGAYLNNNQIHVSDRKELKEAYVAIAYSADPDDIIKGICYQQQLALTARRVVINFAPALDLCNIARGRLDALVDNGSTSEDHAAGSLILAEAQGTMQSMGEDYFDVNITGIIASNGKIQQQILQTIE